MISERPFKSKVHIHPFSFMYPFFRRCLLRTRCCGSTDEETELAPPLASGITIRHAPKRRGGSVGAAHLFADVLLYFRDSEISAVK